MRKKSGNRRTGPLRMEDGRSDLLIVEDSPTQAEQLKYLLEEQGYKVRVAAQGRQALSMTRKKRPDLILSDIVMPEMDGYELCRRIKAEDDLKDIPVLLLTSLSELQDVLKALECSADGFTSKPYEASYLVSCVRQILEGPLVAKIGEIGQGIEVFFEGQRYSISTNPYQTLNLLLSVYGAAVQRNKELIRMEDKLRELNDQLENKVRERTAALEKEVAERRRAEEQVQEKEAILRSYFDSPGAMRAIVEIVNGDILYVEDNMQLAGFLGLSEESIKNRYASELGLPRETVQLLTENYEKCRRVGKPVTFEHEHEAAGVRKWFSTTVSYLGEVREGHSQFTCASFDITEQKQVEQALHESEKRFSQVTEASGDWIWEVDAEGLYTYSSPVVERILGHKPDEIVGKKRFFDLFDPLVKDELKKKAFKMFARKENIKAFRNPNISKDGKRVILETNGLPILDEAGSLVGYRGAYIDITERLHNEEALRESEEKHRSIVSALSEGIVLLAAGGEIIACNSSAESILGLTAEQMAGRTLIDSWWQAIHEDGSPFPGEAHPAMYTLRTGQAQSGVIMGVHKPDGTLSWISINSRPLLRPGRDRPYAVVTSFTDITSKKLGEERLQQQLYWTEVLNFLSTAIAQRNNVQSILRIVMRHLEDSFSFELGGIDLHSDERKRSVVRVLSDKEHPLASLLGLQEGAEMPEDLTGLGGKMEELQANILGLAEMDTSALSEGARVVVQNLRQAGIESMAVIPLVLQNARYGAIFLLFKGIVSFSEYQKSFLHGMAENISLAVQNWKLYEDLERAYSELKRTRQVVMEQERLNAMGQMASGIAHDINNTLAPITLYTEALLESEKGLSERGQRFLQTIQQASRDIESTTLRLRKFYRKAEDRESLQEIDVRQIMEQVIELTRPRWQDMPQRQGAVINIRVEADPELPPLAGNESEVREALVNLVFNAVDAMEQGGKVTLRAVRRDPYLALEVVDAGTGMDEEQKRKCLEPFYTSKGERGSGLGLSMVYGVMQRHDGELEIDSEACKGTTVRLLFPLKQKGADVLLPADEAVTLPCLRILCIDDDETVLQSLKDTLEIDGHEVEAADSGAKALEVFRNQAQTGRAFDVVITDLGMPHMDGQQVAREIKSISSQTPVILLSGWGSLMYVNGERPPNIDQVLGKPPRIAELRAAIGRVLSRKTREG